MANLSAILSASLTVTDTTLAPSPQIITRSLNNPTLSATVCFYDPFFQVGSSATSVPLPANTVWVVMVKNLDATNNITVTYTPVGGGSSTLVLVPGGVFIYFQPSEGAGGITILSLQSSSGTISAEVLIAK